MRRRRFVGLAVPLAFLALGTHGTRALAQAKPAKLKRVGFLAASSAGFGRQPGTLVGRTWVPASPKARTTSWSRARASGARGALMRATELCARSNYPALRAILSPP